MKKVIWGIVGLVITVVLVVIFFLNLTLYYKPVFTTTGKNPVDEDLLRELRFLKNAMAQGAADDMQSLYPEGHVFMHSLYGLTWCEMAQSLDRSSTLYQEAYTEIQKSVLNTASEEARSIFDEFLPLHYGAFYNGWSTYLLGKKLSLEKPEARDPAEVIAFKSACENIASVLQKSNTPYPASYRGGAWPADGVMCLASLAIHDQVFEPLYKNTRKDWVRKVKSQLDPHGLIPHAVDPTYGKVLESARGSSQSLMLCFLPEIDPELAAQQFTIYKSLFVDYRFGLPGIREYPKGEQGAGDVDSGPVILQMGAAATIVGMRAMRTNHEQDLFIALQNGIEAFTFPIREGETRKRFFGQLPMADAFVAWSHAGRNDPHISKNNWRVGFQVYSGLIGVSLLMFLFYGWRRVRRT